MQIISNACELLTPRRLKRNDFADDFNPIRIGGGRNQPYGLLIAFKHAKMEKLKNRNSKKNAIRNPPHPTITHGFIVYTRIGHVLSLVL